MELYKENIDSLVLTPNKQYMVSNYAGYQDYNGKYTYFTVQHILVSFDNEVLEILKKDILKNYSE